MKEKLGARLACAVSSPMLARGLLLAAFLHLLSLPCAHAQRWTTWECVEGKQGTTCKFKNLVFFPGAEGDDWLQAVVHVDNVPEIPYITRSAKFGSGWRPKVRKFENETERDIFLSRVNDVTREPVMYGDLLWPHNIGHFLFDGLYANYNAALRFLDPDDDYIFVADTSSAGCAPDKTTGLLTRQCRQAVDIASTFAGPSGLRTNVRNFLPNPSIIRKFIVGTDMLGIKSYGPKLIRLYESIPDALRHYRNRMYERYNITIPRPFLADTQEIVNAIIVDNKRFSQDDRDAMLKVAEMINKDTSARLNVTYIKWSEIGGGHFANHLKYLTNVAIYITAPGTGMILHPFMRDGTVLVNLGGLSPMVPSCKQPQCMHPNFMEENFVATAWRFQRALYYDSRIRHLGLHNTTELYNLILTARRYVGKPAAVDEELIDGRDPGWTNLPPEGRMLEDLCAREQEAEQACEDMFAAMNNKKGGPGWPCVIMGWVEQKVYESLVNHDGPIVMSGKNVTCPFVPHELLAKYRDSQPYVDQLAKPVFLP